MIDAQVTEVFSSIQGEGIYIGEPQIFVRFAKCNISCDYCDTPKKKAGQYGLFELLDLINSVNPGNIFNVVSLTGGEPLLYADFLKYLLPQLKKRNYKIYLETNGTLPAALEKLLDYIDVVAMDIKLPSSQKGKTFWARHRDFLRLASRKKVFVKVVITAKSSMEEFDKAIRIVNDIDFTIPFIIQPVSPAKRIKKRVSGNRLIEFQALAKKVLNDVRVIPQIHGQLGVR